MAQKFFEELVLYYCMDGTFQVTAGFQDSDTLYKAIKMVLKCIVSFEFLLFRIQTLT